VSRAMEGDRWLSWIGRWVAKLVAHLLLATAALWVEIQTSHRNTKFGDINKGVATIHSSP
jgi:hypothetical protein